MNFFKDQTCAAFFSLKTVLFLLLAAQVLIQASVHGQALRVYQEGDSSTYAGARLTGQLWMRYNENNPGTLINGQETPAFFDISIRRVRLQTYARIRDKTNITFTLGQNNINYLSARSGEIRLLDFYVDHRLHKFLSVGGGQSGWNGTSRYAAPNTSRLLSLDVAPFMIPTVNQTDNVLRKLSAYIKGQIGSWDYRWIFGRPYAPVENTRISSNSTFANAKPGIQTAFYLKHHFFDKESLHSPFHQGTYDGERKVLSLGMGFERQSNAMWHLNAASDTITSPISLIAIDLFGELPGPGDNALTFYSGYFYYNFGPNYLRVIGFNNVGGGLNEQGSFNGTGNAWPAIGTGHTAYVQGGYLWKLKDRNEKIQPFISGQFSRFERLQDPVTYIEGGINILMKGQASKITLAFQNRPVFDYSEQGLPLASHRRSCLILQYQVRLE
ncbi:hypothetical protein SAMN04488057_10713 [Cyclobacterium lianum]|uniref:Porin n=1 Tax=Cyclobacterium lianum TaxID=388280 RepID=A0A1M7P4W2_9BACT|nr:hypothetical protein [Cyclobacterium lianum]SHN11569.1 hypothetical protein SAMN04488057_10713 [Cyclobacterium lianum]